MIEQIRLVPDCGELRIEIKGELAGILELCREGTNRKPGGLSTAGLAEQIKMVAGVCNHRQLTLCTPIWRETTTEYKPLLSFSILRGAI